MKRVEQYIKDYTKTCSNEYLTDSKSDGLGGYISHKNFSPWLTPDQALKAVEIAREEMIKNFICWLKDNFRDDAGLCCIISDFDTTKEMYGDLKQAMKDE